jgi:hypothetical protein
MFSQMGVETGIDMEKLLAATCFLQTVIPQVPITSALFHAGPPKLYTYGETPNQKEKGEQQSC